MRARRAATAFLTTILALCVLTACEGTTDASARGTITGRVVDTDSSNGGVRGATLQLSNAAGASQQAVTTNASGAFEVGNLVPGTWTLQLNAPPNLLFAADETGHRSVTVAASSTSTVVTDIQLARPKGAVSGAVKNGTTGVSGAALELYRAGFTSRPITADASGNFTLAQVPAGNWGLRVSVPSTLQLAIGEPGSRLVVVEANQTTQASAFTLRNPPAIVEVALLGLSFVPQNITVSAGTIVRWRNDEGGNHTITPQNTNIAEFEGNRTGIIHQRTFATPGEIFRYRCEYHSSNFTNGMVGTITVVQ
ncbi:MAG: carboxypeptidase regulatory-like domain-containing protein [Longimicrobiales bacterium]